MLSTADAHHWEERCAGRSQIRAVEIEVVFLHVAHVCVGRLFRPYIEVVGKREKAVVGNVVERQIDGLSGISREVDLVGLPCAFRHYVAERLERYHTVVGRGNAKLECLRIGFRIRLQADTAHVAVHHGLRRRDEPFVGGGLLRREEYHRLFARLRYRRYVGRRHGWSGGVGVEHHRCHRHLIVGGAGAGEVDDV